MQVSMTQLRPKLTGTCGACGGTFESCRCTGAVGALQAGLDDVIKRIEEEDDQDGPSYAVRGRVRHLVADGYTRPRVFTLHRTEMAGSCPLCAQNPCAPLCPFRTTVVGDNR
ncbi:hypothetical protein AB4225_29275 [Streptomyces sp. 2RAF24]|uniref:hypothetical protein n=1 Tax=Streptomyces sp. 2RAF24 TaxID=3232997 RepID=UPI003F995B56